MQRCDQYEASSAYSMAPSSDTRPSELYKLLSREVLWGRMPAAKADAIAVAAVADGVTHPSVRRLASFGSHGFYKKNVWQQWVSSMKHPAMLSAVGKVRVPIKSTGDTINWETVKLPVKLGVGFIGLTIIQTFA